MLMQWWNKWESKCLRNLRVSILINQWAWKMEKDLVKVIFIKKLSFKEVMKSIKLKLKEHCEMVRKSLKGIKHMKIELKIFREEVMKGSWTTKAGKKCMITKQVVLNITSETCMKKIKTNLIKLGCKQHKNTVWGKIFLR